MCPSMVLARLPPIRSSAARAIHSPRSFRGGFYRWRRGLHRCGSHALAVGSDFAGSLRTPAGFNGICGFRPSSGIVGTARRPHAWSPFDVDGPMGLTPADLKLTLAAMAGPSPDDPLSLPFDSALSEAPRPIDLSRVRVAVTEDLGFAPMSKAYRTAFARSFMPSSPCFGVFRMIIPISPALTRLSSPCVASALSRISDPCTPSSGSGWDQLCLMSLRGRAVSPSPKSGRREAAHRDLPRLAGFLPALRSSHHAGCFCPTLSA